MAGPGGGPSRRSHTKSRKGCKTCKRRHIRCDETFPQCRNCTKHQVRCDYLDNTTATGDGSPSPSPSANLLWTPEIEAAVESWQQTGKFPFPELEIVPQPQWHTYSKTDLRLVHHLATITSEMYRYGTSHLTTWTEFMPRFLSAASSHPFVMHSVLSFSASHLAWISQSHETKSLALQHGGTALRGLQQATASFSRANSDAVLASSLLLSWQATDWRSWTSVMMGIKTVVRAMQPWKQEALFADYLSNQGQYLPRSFSNTTPNQGTQDARREHLATLQHVHSHLERLRPYLANYEQERRWIDQLKGYLERLRGSNPPQTGEEQFSQLYALRKWLFWVPISLLSTRKGDIIVLLVLAHFYATALAVEPIFPDTGSAFCADMAVAPLEAIISTMAQAQSSQSYNQSVQTASLMMEFPQETLATFRNRRVWSRHPSQEMPMVQHGSYGLETLNLGLEHQMGDFSYQQSVSPAFPPSSINISPGTIEQRSADYLGIPHSSVEPLSFGRGASHYFSPLGSPAAPVLGPSQEENVFHYGMGMGYPGGFVSSAMSTVWT